MPKNDVLKKYIASCSFLALMLAAGDVSAANCWNNLATQTINFGTVNVPSTVAINEIVTAKAAASTIQGNNQGTIPNGGSLLCVYPIAFNPTLFTSLYDASRKILNTNIPGIGVRIFVMESYDLNPYNWSAPDLSAPLPLVYWSNSYQSDQSRMNPKTFGVQLIRTASNVGSGALTSGIAANFTVNGEVVSSVQFTGNIVPVTPTCSLSIANATFNMGALKTTDFNKGAGATYAWVTDQSLRASSDCNVNTASMTFAGTADTAYPNAFKNNGSAKGVALELWKSGTPQVIPNSMTPITFAAGPNQNFTFSARYIQTAPTVTAGSVNATVTATVNYQ